MAIAVTVAACATAAAAAVLALAPSSSSYHDDVARSGATMAEAEQEVLPAPSRECAVCLSELPAGAEELSATEPAVRALPACGHAFHADCIGRWLPLRPECPSAAAPCRSPTTDSRPPRGPCWHRRRSRGRDRRGDSLRLR